MRLVIQSKLLEVTEPVREYAEKRFGTLKRLLGRFEESGERVLQLEISRATRHHRKGEVYYVEATLPMPGKIIRIEQYDENIRAGIDATKNRLTAAVEEYKDRLEEKRAEVKK